MGRGLVAASISFRQTGAAMCNTHELTSAQMALALDLLFCTDKRREIEQYQEHPDRWALEYVHDGSKQRQLLTMIANHSPV